MKLCQCIDFRFSGIDPQLHAGHFAGRSMYASAILDSDVDKDMTLRLSFDDWFKAVSYTHLTLPTKRIV